MAPEIIGLIGVLILLGLTMIRMPIGLALGSVGIFGTWYLLGWDTMVFALGDAPVAAMSNYTLSVLPLFILMGIVAARAGFANALYQAAFAFVGHRKAVWQFQVSLPVVVSAPYAAPAWRPSPP